MRLSNTTRHARTALAAIIALLALLTLLAGAATVAARSDDAGPTAQSNRPERPSSQDTNCVTKDTDLLSEVEAKVERHKTTGRDDLQEMFTRSFDTMKGKDTYTTAEIKAREDKQGDNWQGDGPNPLWQKVYKELDRLEECREAESNDPTPEPTPTPTPELSITAGGGISEGGTAVFTITADPTPVNPITVNVAVTQDGDFGASGAATVTISGATVTYTVATTDDAADEADGSVTATLLDGDDYSVGTPASATVSVADDDVPEISIAPGNGVTEGAAATFAISANPTPHSPLAVSLSVSQSGDYAAAGTTGSKSVTVPTTGSAPYTVDTVDDGNDEADGSITVALSTRQDYTVGESSSATVSVADNDDASAGLLPGSLDGPPLGSGPQQSFGIGDLVDENGVYTWQDGNREIPLQLLDSLTEAERKELDDSAQAAATTYTPPDSGTTNNGTRGGEPATGNWFSSDTGQVYKMIGGVNVFFAANTGSGAIQGIFNRLGIASDNVEALDGMSGAFHVATATDVETLQLVDKLLKEPSVDSASPNWFTPLSEAFDPQLFTQATERICNPYTDWLTDEYSSCLWHLDSSTDFRYQYRFGRPATDPSIDINIGDAWKTTMGQGVTVAIVDRTWNPSHEDLADNADKSRSTNWGSHTGEVDHNYHGTAVAGVIGARDNAHGGRGVAPRATLLNYNYLDAQGSATHLESFTKNHQSVAVSNHSWGSKSNGLSRQPYSWYRAMATGLNSGFNGKGTSYVKAAGNGWGSSTYPGDGWATLEEASNHPGMIAVCAVDQEGQWNGESERGPNLWVCAPSRGGTNHAGILAPIGDNHYYHRFSGTSAAAPQVSGVIALMRAANDKLTWRDVKVILANTAQKVQTSDPGWNSGALKYGSTTERYSHNDKLGFGVVDADAAVKAAKSWKPLPTALEAKPRIFTGETLIAPGDAKEFSVRGSTSIDFIEHVEVEVFMVTKDFRDLRLTLVSPSGTESILSKEYVDCPRSNPRKNQCQLNGYFKFSTAKLLGEDPSGTWKLKIKHYGGSGTPNARLYLAEILILGHRSATPPGKVATSAVSLSVKPQQVDEGDTVTVTATLSANTPTQVTIPISVTAGTATGPGNGGADYSTSGAANVVIAAGSKTGTATITTVADDRSEADETFTVGLGTLPQGYTSNGTAPTTVTIVDDDQPAVSIAAGSGITEGGTASFTVTANPAPHEPLTVSLSVSQSGDYADAGTIGTKSVTIPTNGSALYDVGTVNDGADEPDGAITVSLSNGRGYSVGSTSSATVSVADDDTPSTPTPVVTIQGSPSVTEGGHAVFQITADPPINPPYRVWLTVSQSGDYAASDEIGTWSTTMTSSGIASIMVETVDDGVDEANGSITASLALSQGTAGYLGVTPINYTIGSPSEATVSVADNDDPPPTVSIAAAGPVTEGRHAVFQITADPPINPLYRVWLTVSQSGDYAASDEIGTWSTTMTSSGIASIMVDTVDDDFDEADGSITVTLAPSQGTAGYLGVTPINYTIGSPSAATVAVADNDDPPPTVSIGAGPNVAEGGRATFQITADPAPSSPLAVSLFVSQTGNYADHRDAGRKTVTIPTTGSATYSVDTVNDGDDEADGSVRATLVAGQGYTLGSPSEATVSVSDDDDPLPRISVSAGDAVTEGDGATFTLKGNPAPKTALPVLLRVEEDGEFASPGTTGLKTVTIPVSGSREFSVATVDDATREEPGSITVTVISNHGYVIAQTHTVSVAVADNDGLTLAQAFVAAARDVAGPPPASEASLTPCHSVARLQATHSAQRSITLQWPAASDADDYYVSLTRKADLSDKHEAPTTGGRHCYTATGMEPESSYTVLVIPKQGGKYLFGKMQGPTTVSTTADPRIVYVIDDSGSMDGDFPEVRTALRAVRDMTGTVDAQMALISFGTGATRLFGFTDHDSAPWNDHINSLGGFKGGTSYYQALTAAKNLFDSEPGKEGVKKIVFMSDSQVALSSFESRLSALDQAGVIIDTVFFGTHYSDNKSVMRKMSTDTGGVHRDVPKPSTGTTNTPAVAARSLDIILPESAAANTTTLYLIDTSFSLYASQGSAQVKEIDAAMAAVQTKVRGIPTARAGMARFMGPVETRSGDDLERYSYSALADFAAGSSFTAKTLTAWTPFSGSTDLNNALDRAYAAISAQSGSARRVVLVTDGIAAAKPSSATLAKYTGAGVCIDVVALGDHADRVYLKTLADTTNLCGDFKVAQ